MAVHRSSAGSGIGGQQRLHAASQAPPVLILAMFHKLGSGQLVAGVPPQSNLAATLVAVQQSAQQATRPGALGGKTARQGTCSYPEECPEERILGCKLL